MRAPSQFETLALWENGRGLHPIDQGVLAVAAACAESPDAIADWPLGRRNRALAQLYASAFGPQLRGWTRCERCNTQLEFQLDMHELLRTPQDSGDEPIVVGEHRFRLPTSRDLAAVAASSGDPMKELLDRCAGERADAEWTEAEIEEIEQHLSAADPLAEIMLHFDCPDCGTSFDETLELASFLWAQFESRARRTLQDVHVLARAYGWSEAEILSLTPARRHFYVEMVSA
jgi:hypothetical protein